MTARPTVLVLACGNPARLDDGLGPALAERLQDAALPGVTVDINYQWTVEDAYELAQHDVAVLVDASVDGPEPLFFQRVSPSADLSFSSHSVTPQALLGIAIEHFGAKTTLYVLGIRGYEFDDFGETLSDRAQDNLDEAFVLLTEALRSGNTEGLSSKVSDGRRQAPQSLASPGRCRSTAACCHPGVELKPT